MNVREMFPSKYVTGADLNGKAWTVTISRIVTEKMRPNIQSPEVERFVIYTAEGKRGIVLSKALAFQIAKVLGDDTEGWTGKKIAIYPESMTVAGVARVAIRARQATNGNGA